MSQICTPLFKTDNTEELATADAYDVSDTRPINKVYNAAKEGTKKLYDKAGGKTGVINGVRSIAQAVSNGATGKELLERGLGVFGTSTANILSNAGNGIFDKAAAFINLDPAMASRIKTTGMGVFTTLRSGDPKDLANYAELTSLVAELTGSEEFLGYVNKGIESAVWAAALTEAIQQDLHYFMSEVKQFIDPEVYHQSMIYSIPAVATSGSIYGLKELLNELSEDEIVSNKTDFIRTFLTSFIMPSTITGTVEEYAIELVELLSQLDPLWYIYTRSEGEEIVDHGLLTTASQDALVLLETHPVLSVHAIAAPTMPELSIEEVIRRQFPLMVTNLR